MKLRYRFALMAGSLLLVAGVSFLATRSLLPGAAGAGGPEGPDKVKHIRDTIATSVASGTPPPTPPPLDPTQQAKIDQIRATVTARQRETFYGELNGFTLYDPAKETDTAFARLCNGLPAVPVHDRAKAVAEEAAFTTRSWPEGLGPVQEQTIGCSRNGTFQPVSYKVTAFSPDYRTVSVFRQIGPPSLPSAWAKEDLSLVTVGGRPGLLWHNDAKNWTTVLMRDARTVWMISCAGVSKTICLDVAQGAQ